MNRGPSYVLTLWALALLCPAGLRSAPAIVVDPPTANLGRQVENKGEYNFRFTVKNTGDEVLQITRVRPGCSCTKVELKKTELAPGESTEMTGVLTTRGVEGLMSKGIILTSNDPVHATTVANVEVRFPYAGVGLVLRGNPTAARLRQGALWAYVTVVNCEPDREARIEAMELPEGWDCVQTLPVIVRAEDRMVIQLKRDVGEAIEPEAFSDLPFTFVTDSAKTPRVQGAITYKPVTKPISMVSPAVSRGPEAKGPAVRWPMTKPVPGNPAPAASVPTAPGASTGAGAGPGPTSVPAAGGVAAPSAAAAVTH